MTVLYVLIALNYLFLLLGAVTALLLTASFSRPQREQFPVLRRLDGRKLGLTIAAIAFLALGYAAYGIKEAVLVRLSFRVVPGPGTSQVIQATGIELEFMEAAAHQANAARESFTAGQVHFAAGRYREAADYYQRSIAALPTLSAVLNRGLSLRYLSDYPAAEVVLRTGLRLASQQHRELFEAHFRLYLSSVLIGQGKYSEAEPVVAEALRIYERIGDDIGQANAHLNLGNILSSRGGYAEGVNEWRKALKAFSQGGNILGQANVTNNLAGVHLGRLELADSALAYSAALAFYERIDNQTGIVRASDGLASVYLTQGRLTEALTLLRRGLDRAVREGDKERRCVELLTIGAVRDEQGKWDDAIAAELIALQLAREMRFASAEGSAHIVLASSYRHLGRLSDAHDHATRAIEIYRRTGESGPLSFVLSESGAGYLAEHRFAEAADAFHNALAIADSNGLLGERAVALAGLGMTEAALGHSELALQFLLPAHQTFSRAGVKLEPARETEQLITRLQRERLH
jgi:hypothetical protein